MIDPIMAGLEMLEPILARLDTINARVSRLEVIAAMSHNGTAGDGNTISFLEVPFPNGDLPAVNLPPLTSVNAVAQLDGENSALYHARYYPGIQVPHRLRVRKEAICQAIGCRQMSVRV
ncbi:hypothetical protein BC827DRAFT_159227 [Russula dissimulans]|nr:hypothetical protein BC827DRAFT_159227 [Russula dissimulans]